MHDYVHWTAYNDRQDGRPVRDLCRAAMAAAGPGRGRTAIDLGCGAGIESFALAQDGWQVLAIDGEPGAAARMAGTADTARMAGAGDAGAGAIDVRETDFRLLDFLPPAELIHAEVALPYLPRPEFERVWQLIRAAATGTVAASFFGVNDSWSGDPEKTFLTEEEIRALFDGFEIVHWLEEDAPGQAFSGPKHWHLFEVVAKR